MTASKTEDLSIDTDQLGTKSKRGVVMELLLILMRSDLLRPVEAPRHFAS